jgi:hypothetical protein
MPFQEQLIGRRNVQQPRGRDRHSGEEVECRCARNAQKQSRSAQTRQSLNGVHGSQDKWQVRLSCEFTIARSQSSLPIASLMVAGSVNILPGA